MEVHNEGAAIPAGLPVGLYITDTHIGTAVTTHLLDTGESERITVTWDAAATGSYTVTIVPNDWENEDSRRVLCSMPPTTSQVIRLLVLTPVGGYTEPASAPAVLWSRCSELVEEWVALIAAVGLGTIVTAAALKKHRDGRRITDRFSAR